jgi:hypothetical protein
MHHTAANNNNTLRQQITNNNHPYIIMLSATWLFDQALSQDGTSSSWWRTWRREKHCHSSQSAPSPCSKYCTEVHTAFSIPISISGISNGRGPRADMSSRPKRHRGRAESVNHSPPTAAGSAERSPSSLPPLCLLLVCLVFPIP